MKRALTVFGMIVVVADAAVYVASWFWAGDEVAAAAALPWPDDLGTVAAVAERYPTQRGSEPAVRLSKLAEAVAPDDAVTALHARRDCARRADHRRPAAASGRRRDPRAAAARADRMGA